MAISTIPMLPFSHLNLRRNPFGELTTEEWTALADVDVVPLLQLLSVPRSVIQFIGGKGYGKTTHLLAIRSQFESASYVHIPEGESRSIPAGWPVLIDEAQRLTRWQRIRIFRPLVPLVLATHSDFSRALRGAGREVTTIEVEDRTNSERLHRILNARIDAARRSPGETPTVSHATAQKLLNEFGPDIRRILHVLYGRIQRLDCIAEL
ncbi:MAG: hypothetical protein MK102_15275 [Fuerstiella sp.]|nr:hypothetical protein [Fuerstiella sp.]